MERALRGPTWTPEVAAPRTGIVAGTGRVLLLCAVAFSLVWFPVARTGAGTIAGSDAALFALWAVTALDLLLRGASGVEAETASMVILALAVAALAALGAELSGAGTSGSFEFMLFLKRFGLAAVIPLATSRFGSPGLRTAFRVLTALAMIALVVFVLRPELHALLPKPEDWEEGRETGRAMGLGMNPNNLAYAAVALAVLHGAFLPRGAGLVGRLAAVGVLAGAALCVVVSGSRSGLLGASGALALLLVRSSLDARARLGLVAGAAAALAVGLVTSPVFQERLGRVYRLGAAEANVSGRLHAQALAVSASVQHPFGVGYRGIGWATQSARTHYAFETTDSVYLDTLLAAGVAGLLALLLLFRAGWRHLARAGPRRRSVTILQAGFVAFLLFGAATVVPISVFLAPLFFTTIAGASHAPDDD
jgi:O-antigen ligase